MKAKNKKNEICKMVPKLIKGKGDTQSLNKNEVFYLLYKKILSLRDHYLAIF